MSTQTSRGKFKGKKMICGGERMYGFEMKIIVDGVERQILYYNTAKDVHKELKRKYIERVIEAGNEIQFEIINLKQ